MSVHRFLQLLSSGAARCIYDPRSRDGFEGYSEGDPYRYEECLGDKGRHPRIYPCGAEGPSPDYFEVHGPGIFGRYFEPITREELAT